MTSQLGGHWTSLTSPRYVSRLFEYKKILPIFHEGLENYFKQDWDKAIEAFKTADELEEMFPGRKTNPSRIYIPRCQNFKANPPGDDWDGVWTQTSK